MDYSELLKSIRSIAQHEGAPVKIREGRWLVENKLSLTEKLEAQIFDVHLDVFKECAVEVLKEVSPEFDLPPEERYSALIHGKVLKNSHHLRHGLAEFAALLGVIGELKNCSRNKASYIACLIVREIFSGADWKLWGTLNDLLPVLAEADPSEFIAAVETALNQSRCPFDELFSQEGAGIAGRNYLTGLLWALEKLAWHEDYIVHVSVILAQLATHDPGGNWANRPINSITTLLLPWHPQTLASIDKRIACMHAIKSDFPDVSWKVLLTLLPNQHQFSSGNSKPVWRGALPNDFKVNVTNEEYREQVQAYSNMVVELAGNNIDYLQELTRHLDNLPEEAFDAALEKLAGDVVVSLDETKRLPIWMDLTGFITKHRKFNSAKWALPETSLNKIDAVAKKLEPVSPR